MALIRSHESIMFTMETQYESISRDYLLSLVKIYQFDYVASIHQKLKANVCRKSLSLYVHEIGSANLLTRLILSKPEIFHVGAISE